MLELSSTATKLGPGLEKGLPQTRTIIYICHLSVITTKNGYTNYTIKMKWSDISKLTAWSLRKHLYIYIRQIEQQGKWKFYLTKIAAGVGWGRCHCWLRNTATVRHASRSHPLRFLIFFPTPQLRLFPLAQLRNIIHVIKNCWKKYKLRIDN